MTEVDAASFDGLRRRLRLRGYHLTTQKLADGVVRFEVHYRGWLKPFDELTAVAAFADRADGCTGFRSFAVGADQTVRHGK